MARRSLDAGRTRPPGVWPWRRSALDRRLRRRTRCFAGSSSTVPNVTRGPPSGSWTSAPRRPSSRTGCWCWRSACTRAGATSGSGRRWRKRCGGPAASWRGADWPSPFFELTFARRCRLPGEGAHEVAVGRDPAPRVRRYVDDWVGPAGGEARVGWHEAESHQDGRGGLFGGWAGGGQGGFRRRGGAGCAQRPGPRGRRLLGPQAAGHPPPKAGPGQATSG